MSHTTLEDVSKRQPRYVIRDLAMLGFTAIGLVLAALAVSSAL